ncbi:MAG: ComF family protein [Fimbriimonas sp.]|nr:ComF family protein [Fimbriimonas sp.]
MSKASDLWISFSSTILDTVYPPKCALCRSLSKSNPCIQCIAEMEAADPVFSYWKDGPVDFRATIYRYPGRAGQAVRRLKYNRATSLAPFMAYAIAGAIVDEGLEFDLAAPIPIHWTRLASRGFNQADVLAERLPNRAACLRRSRATRPQAGLSTDERLKNLEGAFEVIRDVEGKRILLIDDVVTSGKTARECAKVLKLRGALEVGVMAFCGDPLD